jgi:hypothetical protein
MVNKMHEYFSPDDDMTAMALKCEKLKVKLNEAIDTINELNQSNKNRE